MSDTRTPRERLLDVIYFTECANEGTTPEEVINKYRRQVAHELAEQIRAENPQHTYAWASGADWAADLIDPKVNQ